MAECCKGPNPTHEPGAAVCKGCPCPPRAKRFVSVTDPEYAGTLAAKMKDAGTFDKDEPWPGWNGGKKLVEKEPDDPQVDEGVEIPCEFLPRDDAWLADQFFANLDYAKIEERVLAMLGMDVDEWNALSEAEKGAHVHKVFGGMFARGGVVSSPTGRTLFGMGASHDAVFPPSGLVVNGSLRGYSEYNKGPKNWDHSQVVVHQHGEPLNPHVVINVIGSSQSGKSFEQFKKALDDKIVRSIGLKKEMLVPAPKRYATHEETKGVRVGTVTYQTERGTIFREERRPWNDRDEERYMDLSSEAHKFSWQMADKWSAGEARVYSMYRTAKAQRERGYMVKKKTVVGRNGKRTDVVEF